MSNVKNASVMNGDGGDAGGGLDIEQGGNISESTDADGRRNAAAGTSTTPKTTLCTTSSTATQPLIRGLEKVDVEEADIAPVPLVQQIAQKEEADNDVASEDASASATNPSTQCTLELEQIEDDDNAAPRPLNYVEFEDEPQSKIASMEQALDDVENSDQHSASDNEDMVSQVITAAARNPSVSVTVVEAYLVEEESDEDGHVVCEATPVEPELPWWKQRRTKVFMMINCVLLIALALSVGLGVASSRPNPTADNTTIIVIDRTVDPSVGLLPTKPPIKPPSKCFADRKELKAVVERYIQFGCGAVATLCTADSDTYGWPIGSWCVDNVTDMSSLFEGLDTFNEDISEWNVGNVTNMNRMFFEATSFSGNVSSWDVSSVANARAMFKVATSFNGDLCAWSENFPYGNANNIFVGSGCLYQGDPLSEYQGPFCASSCNTVSPTDCFTTRDELRAAVSQYVQGYWGTADSSKYGWPIGVWCVGKVTDMTGLFEGLDTFNEDISRWEVGQVTDMNRSSMEHQSLIATSHLGTHLQ
jgi:surface protein